LQKRDREILDAFLSYMKSTAPLAYVAPREENEQGYYRMSIYNKHMSRTLEKHGVTANKTFNVIYPTWLPEELQHHFVRGVFDGDGCISTQYYDNDKLKNTYVSILGTNDLCTNIQQRLSIANITSRMTDTNKTDIRIRTLWITSRQNVVNFGNWLYKDATIWLSRKKDRFDALK